jgi:hypothetical protein
MCTRRILVSAFRLFFCFLCLRAALVRLTLRGAVGRGVLLFFGKNRVHYYTHHPHFPTAPLALFVLRLIISKRSEYQTTILSSSFFLLTVNCQFFSPKKNLPNKTRTTDGRTLFAFFLIRILTRFL